MNETRTIQCPECRGMGDCPTCDGTGKVEATRTADRPSLRDVAERVNEAAKVYEVAQREYQARLDGPRPKEEPDLDDPAVAAEWFGPWNRMRDAERVFWQAVAALRQALEGESHREARQRHVPGAIDIFGLVCSCGWRQINNEDWWVHVTSEREFAFRPSTGSEER